jgi:hypothetical protein
METRKVAATKPKVPVVDKVVFTGACAVLKRNGIKQLCIFQNEEEAVKYGIPKRTAKDMFAGWFGPSNCIIEFSIWGNVSCGGSDDCLPGKTCVLQMWDKPTKSWKDHSEGGSALHVGATWRCKCK